MSFGDGRQEEEGEEALGPVKPMKDLSIAEGQKLHIGLKVRVSGGRDYILQCHQRVMQDGRKKQAAGRTHR